LEYLLRVKLEEKKIKIVLEIKVKEKKITLAKVTFVIKRKEYNIRTQLSQLFIKSLILKGPKGS